MPLLCGLRRVPGPAHPLASSSRRMPAAARRPRDAGTRRREHSEESVTGGAHLLAAECGKTPANDLVVVRKDGGIRVLESRKHRHRACDVCEEERERLNGGSIRGPNSRITNSWDPTTRRSGMDRESWTLLSRVNGRHHPHQVITGHSDRDAREFARNVRIERSCLCCHAILRAPSIPACTRTECSSVKSALSYARRKLTWS